MKRYFLFTVFCFMLTSCYVESPITLEKHFIEVDYNAQEIILNADEEILNISSFASDLGRRPGEV